MKSNKQKTYSLAAFCIALAVFNLIAFLAPFAHTGVFWAGYVFGMIAILAQIPVLFIAFRGADSARSKFYGLPIARLGLIYLVVQLVLSLAAMCLAWVSALPAWPFILVFLLLLAAAALGTIAADVTRDEITWQDTKLKKDVKKLRELQSLGRSLVTQCEDPVLSAELKKLSESLQYSDPVSSAATAETETELASLLDELQKALLDGDTASASGLCKRAATVLAERNRICKLNK